MQAGRQSAIVADRRAQAAPGGQGCVPSHAALQSPSAPTSAQRAVVHPLPSSTPLALRQEEPKSLGRAERKAAVNPGVRAAAARNLLADESWRAGCAAGAVCEADRGGRAPASDVIPASPALVDAPGAKAAQTAPAPRRIRSHRRSSRSRGRTPGHSPSPTCRDSAARRRTACRRRTQLRSPAPSRRSDCGESGTSFRRCLPGRSRRRRNFRGAHRYGRAHARTTKGFRRRRSTGRWSTPASRPGANETVSGADPLQTTWVTSNEGQPVTEISRVSGATRSPAPSLIPASETGTM